MLLSAYVESVIAEPDRATKDTLQVDLGLLRQLQSTAQTSETLVQEMGCVLHWLPRLRRLSPGPEIMGRRCEVNWRPEGLVGYGYVGTFHTHPYRKKLGDDVAMGFSNGDFAFYGMNFPDNAPINVHIVISNRTLYLAVYRATSRRLISDDAMNRYGADEQEFRDLLRRERLEGAFLQMEVEVAELQQVGRVDASAAVERAFFDRFPGYKTFIMQGNERMMRTAARDLRVELYVGKVGGTLRLKSDHVYLGGGRHGRLQRDRDLDRRRRHPGLA